MPFRALALAAALAAPLGGCVHAPAVAGGPPRGDPGAVETALVTGSRLSQPLDPATGQARTTSRVDVYSSGDLARTGRPDLAQALRAGLPTGR